MPNHPNRGPKGPTSNPTPIEVKALRERVQTAFSLGVTAAQAWCAERVCADVRSWQKWENDERRMHPGFWKLANIEVSRALTNIKSS